MKLTKLWQNLGALIVLAAFLLVGCSAFQPAPTPEVEVEEDTFNPVVSATGVIVPELSSTLSMSTAGLISEVLVEENDSIEAGQVLVRLEGREYLQAAIAAARYELAMAKHAREQLDKDPELRIAQANQAVVDARIAVRDFQRRVDNLQATSPARDIEQASANLAILKDKLDKARKDYAPYENKPEDNLVRAGLLSKLAQIEKEYEAAARRLNNMEGTVNELDMGEAEADLAMAQASLVTALREYDLAKAGPNPDEVAMTEARIENAEAQLAAAEDSLVDLELLAPFGGTVTDLYVKPSQWIAPGQPVIQVADLEGLRIETTDLNEIDVARVQVGDTALVSFDALPDVTVKGIVTQIAPKATEGAGVNYTVWVKLEEIPENLRWGMTAFLDIEVGS